LAIVQQPMEWTTAGNVEHILAALAQAAEQGADVCVFPELALTGFHRGIRGEALPAVVEPALERVRSACRDRAIACVLGLPTFGTGDAVLNSYVFIDAAGETALTVHKNGLTPAEQTFFQPGVDRPAAMFAGHLSSTVMCREIDDLETIALQWQDVPVELIFWPALVGQHPGTVLTEGKDPTDLGYVRGTAELARRLEAYVVQSNWPVALNTPESTYLGESKVYAPNGEILLQLPRDQAGIGVFTLGERVYRWTPWPV
jgi:predicted amidohydrolase